MSGLDLKTVSSGYGSTIIVQNASLTVGKGEIVALVGKNGMGKSTLLKTVMGFVRARTGSVELFGEDITGAAPHMVARKALSYTPQEQPLFQDMSVEENLQIVVRDKAKLKAGVERMSGYFPFIGQRLGQKAGTLSGGEQKMLLVSRALMTDPRILLIDEITEGLQPSMIDRLQSVFLAERERRGMAMLIVEQHVSFALGVADRYAVLKLGEVVDIGPAKAPEARARVAQHLAV